MGDSDRTCCICFPLDCGITTVAIITILSTIVTGITAFTTEGGWALYGVGFAVSAIMSIVWIYALAAPSEESRKIAFLTWIVSIVVVGRIWYTYVILNGSIFDSICHEETIAAINEAGITETITAEECAWGGKRAVWADHVVGWLFEIYLATAIQRWT